jgi:hypothetical protein
MGPIIDVFFLSETMVQSNRFRLVFEKFGFSAWLEVPPIGIKGGLFLAWKQGVIIEPYWLDQNMISCLVYSDHSNSPWLLSYIYAPHSRQSRSVFWSKLCELGNSFGGHWILLGDFNTILSPLDKCGGRDFNLVLLLIMNLLILTILMLLLIWVLLVISILGTTIVLAWRILESVWIGVLLLGNGFISFPIQL